MMCLRAAFRLEGQGKVNHMVAYKVASKISQNIYRYINLNKKVTLKNGVAKLLVLLTQVTSTLLSCSHTPCHIASASLWLAPRVSKGYPNF